MYIWDAVTVVKSLISVSFHQVGIRCAYRTKVVVAQEVVRLKGHLDLVRDFILNEVLKGTGLTLDAMDVFLDYYDATQKADDRKSKLALQF